MLAMHKWLLTVCSDSKTVSYPPKFLAGTGHGHHPRRSAVHAVVDAVNEVGRVGRQAHEVLLVLLDDLHEPWVDIGDAEDVADVIVWAMGADDGRCSGEHARELAVGLDVGVVDVHPVAAAQELQALVVHPGVGRHRRHGHSGGRSHAGHLLLVRIEPAQNCANTEAGRQHAEGTSGLGLSSWLLEVEEHGLCRCRGGRQRARALRHARARCHVGRRRGRQQRSCCKEASHGADWDGQGRSV
mmetsp:Transcript_78155/g.141034  ORF Transcript_78155/g.141034 Transcript_78155/m.141034 type:complete len:242 (+) Transcript_78155:129-854(+)